MEDIKQRISQTEPNSSINLQQIDTTLSDCFYQALKELKNENQLSEEHKKNAKIQLIENNRELLQLLFNSKGDLKIMKENVIKFIKSHFQMPPRAMKESSFSSNSSLLEVQISRNSGKSPSNISSQNKPEISTFLKYLEDLLTNSPSKLNQYDKKQLQKIFKKLQQVVFDQSSPLAPQRKSLNSSNHNLLSAGNLSPVKNQFSSEDILSLYNIYKSIKSVYKDLLRLAQLFVQDNLNKQQTLYNVNKLLKDLINVDSFCFISNPNTGCNSATQAQPQQQKKSKADEGGALQSIRVSESIIQENKQQKDQDWIFFDSESYEKNQSGYSFSSDTLADEISQLHQGLIELKDLDSNTFPTIIAKCSSYNSQYKAYVYKFYNLKSESYEIISLRYENEISFFNEKSKIITNNLALPIYQNQAFTYLGQFIVNTIQNLNSQSECSFQIIDLSHTFLNFGKNLLIDSFQQKLKSTFKINTHVKQIDTKESKSQDAEERASLFKNSQLVLEDDYSDIVFQSTSGESILNDPALYTFFIEISHYFAKYKQFLLKMSQKVFVYKYFLRNQYQTFLDISKKGQLKFISHSKSNLDIDYNDIQERPLKIEDIFKNNKNFIKEFYEIIEYFKQPLEEQEKVNLKHHKEEENEKQKIQKNENILPNVLQLQDEDIPFQPQNRSSIQQEIKIDQQNSQNSCLSPDFGEKFNNQNLNGIGEQKSNNNNNGNNANNNNNNNNKSFVSSASKSYRPFKSYIKKPNTWFNLKSIPDSQIYVQILPQKQKIVIQSIFINIQDDFHSDSCTNFESFYQLDDILNSLNNSEFNDPRIKLILKKLYSKINSFNIEEKVSIENQNTQIEMFTQNHRERFTSTPAIGASQKSSVIMRQTAKLNQSKQLSNNSPTALQKQQLEQQYLKNLLHATPAVTNIDDWDFNVFELRSVEEKYTTAWNILQRAQYFESCSIPEDVFANFVKELQKQYDIKNNDFHNFDHGVSVMQSCYMLSKCQRATQVLKPIDIFTVILSGLCHDVGHTGRTNNFEISVQSKLAIRYHDKSVLEQHHLATTFKIMKQSLDYNILQNLEPITYNQVRRSMISNILYTDIKQHFKLILDFETQWKNYDEQLKTTNSEGEIDLLTGMIIHTADFTGAAKPFPLSRQWSEKVNREFHNQYIEEGKRGVEQTSFMKDLDILHVMAKAEKGFLSVIVLPLWKSLNDFYKGELNTQIEYLTDSINQWGELSQQVPQQASQPQQVSQNNEEKVNEACEDIKQIESSSESDDDGDIDVDVDVDEESNLQKQQQQQNENIKNASDYEEDKNSNEIIFEMDNEESNEKLNTINCEDSENQQPSDSSPHQ
ncbi:3',5'-cyclic-nucleotide phosphodiesterase (macronuclear) [Tetrahymena thermophila SB210]|uniref:Phosphodiesterase n=1 Tax=Tetrahymena thermophila (strain SB210) TaxID=312017 RepID=Q22CV4_TETTS|nr:3',5'-cyclic-nucleotide phosphodiesterase [Tetrahymena thermophila SB210]EAR83084.2 3',5'-cyclic-nucleotide phosphodiesterase [Tetrahymena thermophila SB210]|eukprot:XP_001030747.2 3',5'-cyclic-nucleotide phosphodiesterase [Tetrahymena thermophila SB210]